MAEPKPFLRTLSDDLGFSRRTAKRAIICLACIGPIILFACIYTFKPAVTDSVVDINNGFTHDITLEAK